MTFKNNTAHVRLNNSIATYNLILYACMYAIYNIMCNEIDIFSKNLTVYYNIGTIRV